MMEDIVAKSSLGFVGFLLGGGLALFAYSRRFFSLDNIKKEEFTFPSIFAVLAAFIIYFGTQIVAFFVARVFAGFSLDTPTFVKITIVGISTAALFLTLFSTLHKIWFRRSDASIFSAFKTALCALIIAFPLVAGINNLLLALCEYLLGPENALQLQDAVSVLYMQTKTDLFFPLALTIGIAVPVAEEILFRGYLQTWLGYYFRQSWALILASFMFTGFHYSSFQGVANLAILPPLFLLSLLLGFIYQRERTLWASIFLHALYNITGVVMIYFQ